MRKTFDEKNRIKINAMNIMAARKQLPLSHRRMHMIIKCYMFIIDAKKTRLIMIMNK